MSLKSLKKDIIFLLVVASFGFLGGATASLGMRWLASAIGLEIPGNFYYLVVAAGCVGGILFFGALCAFILSSSISREEEVNSPSFRESTNGSSE